MKGIPISSSLHLETEARNNNFIIHWFVKDHNHMALAVKIYGAEALIHLMFYYKNCNNMCDKYIHFPLALCLDRQIQIIDARWI